MRTGFRRVAFADRRPRQRLERTVRGTSIGHRPGRAPGAGDDLLLPDVPRPPTPAGAQHAHGPPSAQPRPTWQGAAPPRMRRPGASGRGEPVVNATASTFEVRAGAGDAADRHGPEARDRTGNRGSRRAARDCQTRGLLDVGSRLHRRGSPWPAPGAVACLASARVHGNRIGLCGRVRCIGGIRRLRRRRSRRCGGRVWLRSRQRGVGEVGRGGSAGGLGRASREEMQADRGSRSRRWSCGCRGGRTGHPAPVCPTGRWRPPPAPPRRGRRG